MRQLLLATNNGHKAGELRSLLADVPVEILTLEQFPSIGAILEDQETLEANALKKARGVFRLTNVPTLADDSGLEVDYLNKGPGVYSSRYAGPDATYADNCKKLLLEMKGVPPRRRGAQFRCVLAFVTAPDFERVMQGACLGVITELPRGSLGFGYDPLFLPDGCRQTLAEMEPTLKNRLSHRAKAIQNMKPILSDFFAHHST
jgi:XTP/dITP diphosphohydrolase